ASASGQEGPVTEVGKSSAQEFGTQSVQAAWPELSSALASRNPDAGETARAVEVIGVDGSMLHLGFVNDAHLNSFKTLCAAIIRSGFQERFGVTVQYRPWTGPARIAEGKQLFGAAAPISQEPGPHDLGNAGAPEAAPVESFAVEE